MITRADRSKIVKKWTDKELERPKVKAYYNRYIKAGVDEATAKKITRLFWEISMLDMGYDVAEVDDD